MLDGATKTGVDQPEFVEAVEFYNRLKAFSLYDDNIVVRKAFQENKIGFMIDEPGQIERLKKESPEINFGAAALTESNKDKPKHCLCRGANAGGNKKHKKPCPGRRVYSFSCTA